MRTVNGGVWLCGRVPLGALGNGFQVVLALKMTPLFPSLSLSPTPLSYFFSVILPLPSTDFSFRSPSVICFFPLRAYRYILFWPISYDNVPITGYIAEILETRILPTSTSLNCVFLNRKIKSLVPRLDCIHDLLFSEISPLCWLHRYYMQ